MRLGSSKKLCCREIVVALPSERVQIMIVCQGKLNKEPVEPKNYACDITCDCSKLSRSCYGLSLLQQQLPEKNLIVATSDVTNPAVLESSVQKLLARNSGNCLSSALFCLPVDEVIL